MYGAVGSLASSEVFGPVDLESGSARAAGFNRVMILSKLCMYTSALANQGIHPFVFGKLVQAIFGSNSALRSVRGDEVDGWLLVWTSVLHLGLHGADKA